MHNHLSNFTPTSCFYQAFAYIMSPIKHFSMNKSLALALLVATSPGEKNFAQKAADVPAWPHPIPCRIQDGANPDLFVMTLGDVQTPLADGVFDPVKDEVVLKDGIVKTNYYRDGLGVKFYQPLDKLQFPQPPSGWCTWYYYYNRVTAAEVQENAKWIAANLKDFGAQLIGGNADGLQLAGQGLGRAGAGEQIGELLLGFGLANDLVGRRGFLQQELNLDQPVEHLAFDAEQLLGRDGLVARGGGGLDAEDHFVQGALFDLNALAFGDDGIAE